MWLLLFDGSALELGVTTDAVVLAFSTVLSELGGRCVPSVATLLDAVVIGTQGIML
jgi:hypothetical protein